MKLSYFFGWVGSVKSNKNGQLLLLPSDILFLNVRKSIYFYFLTYKSMIRKLSEKILYFKKKYENSALILNGLIMIACGAILIDKLNYLITEDKKLSPEIWGTVSDWFMVLVTLVTAVFLYKTLKSQMDVQKQQSILANIEIKRFRKTVLPKIFIGEKSLTSSFDTANNLYNLFYTLVFAENPALDVTIYSNMKLNINLINKEYPQFIYEGKNDDTDIAKLYKYEMSGTTKPNTGILINFKLIENLILDSYKSFNDTIIIRFRDIENYEYEEKIHFIKSKNSDTILLEKKIIKFL